MRQYDDLTTLIGRETTSKFPRFAAREVEQTTDKKSPTSTALVLFKSGREWEVLPVGPAETLKNTAQAARSHPRGMHAVAYCLRTPAGVETSPPASAAVSPSES